MNLAHGQTVLSGTYIGAPITGDISILSSTSATFTSGTTFSGANATLGNYATLNWNQNGTLSGKTFTMGSGAYATIYLGGAYSLTLDSATSLNGGVYLYGTTGSTIINQGTINQTAGTGYFYGPTVTNSGNITVGANAGLYFGYYNGEITTNAVGGSITANGSNSIVYLHSLFNQGSLFAQNGGILEFTGPSVTANLVNVNLTTGGRALLGGYHDNTSATLTAPSGGQFELYGGTILNGTIATGALTFTTSGGTLDGATITGDLGLPSSTSVSFANGATFTGANAALGNYSNVTWNQNGTLTGKTFTMGSGGAYATLYVGNGYSFTAGTGTSFSGTVNLYGGSGATLINQGAINNTSGSGYFYAPTATNASGGTITVGANSSFYFGYYNGETTTNAAGGVVTANGSNATVYLHSLINQGSVNALNGGLLIFTGPSTAANLGNISLSSGARALLNGTIDNTSTTLAAPTGGVYELYGGTINNGTIGAGALSFTSSGGTLNTVSYTGNLNVPSSTSVTFTGGTTFTGASATIGSYGNLTYNQSGTISGKTFTMGASGAYGSLYVGNGYSLTTDSATSFNGTVYLYGGTGSTLINQGAINHTSGYGYFYAPTATNASGGTITVNGGSTLSFGYYAGETTTNAAGGTVTVDGAGSIVYLHSLINQGTVNAQNGGTLIFNGTSTTTANLGTVVLSTGGHAWLNGVIDNTSATLTAPTGGSYELYGGTINNGTIGAGALTFTSSGGFLSGVSYAGNLVMPANTNVTFTNGTTFTGTTATLGNYATLYLNQSGTLSGKAFTLGSSGAYGTVYVGSGNTVTAASTTSFTGSVYLYGSTGSTLINQGAVNQTSGYGYFYAPTATNASGGTITVNGGSSLYFGYYDGEVTTNASGGAITVDGAGSYIYLHSLINLGTVTAQNGGIAQFTGASTTTANLGNVVLASGGRALLNGTIDNTSATLTAPTGGTYELYAGTINNGTIGSGALSFTTSGGTLSGVSLTGNLTLPASTTVTFTNGTTFTGASASIGNYATIFWNQSGTVSGKAFTMGSGSAYGAIYVGNGNALTFDSATTLTGNSYLYGYSGSSIVNQGAINQNSSSGYGYFYGPSVTNGSGGTITVSTGSTLYFGYYDGETTNNASGGTMTANGASAYLYLHNIVNQGTLNAQNTGNLVFTGSSLTTANLGNITLATGGHALLNGTLNNTASTLSNITGGIFELYGGAITNGTIGAGLLGFTSSGGTLSGVTLNGDLTMSTVGSYAYLTNGTTFTGVNASLANNSGLYWQQIGTLAGKAITMGSGAYLYVSGVNSALTLGAGTTVTGTANIYSDGNVGTAITNQGTITQSLGTGNIYARTFINSGTINATAGSLYLGNGSSYTVSNTAGSTIAVNGGSIILQSPLTNNGTLNVQSGTFYSGSFLTNGSTGLVQGSGTISGNLTMAGGTIAPGNSIGTLTLTSSAFAVTAPSSFVVEVNGASSDQVIFQSPTSNVNIGSGLLTLSVQLLGTPTSGTTYNIMSIASGTNVITGTFAGLPTSGSSVTATFGTQSYAFSVNYLSNAITLNFAPVPEPSTYALLGAGLTLLAVGGRRRFRRR